MKGVYDDSLRRVSLSKIFLFLVLTTVTIACSSSNAKSTKEKELKRPNIVFIYADDMGYGEIEALNPDRSNIPTPHLNKLASEGMVFTDAHTTSSVCTPSRYALLTGRYNWRSRLQLGVGTGGGEPLISADRLTLPGMLASHGYATSMVGKWHLEYGYKVPKDLENEPLSKSRKNFLPAPYPIGTHIVEGPITRGFETFYGFHHSRQMSSIIRNDVIEKEISASEVLTSLTNEVVKVIGEKAEDAKNGKPFFIYFAQNSPHTPIAPSEPWKGKTDLGPYGDFVAETDGSVGSVLDALDENGLSENTIVIFSADNGTSRAAKLDFLASKGHFPSAELRGSKADLWEGGHRVPFVVRWPGHTEVGVKNNQLICMSDWIATFAEFLDADLPENAAEDSWSFLPALRGETVPDPRTSVVHHSISGRFAIRSGDWKLLLAPGSGGWTAPNDVKATDDGLPSRQLYRLNEDLGEGNNIIENHLQKEEELTKLLQDIVGKGRSTPGKDQKNDVEIDIFKTEKNKAKQKG